MDIGCKLEKIVLIGGGGHAKVAVDILNRMNKYEIVGVIVDKSDDKTEFLGYPVFQGDEKLKDFYIKGIYKAVIGVGGYRDNDLRKRIYELLKSLNFEPINVIDPSAIISKSVRYGEGNVIFPGVILNTDVVLGNNIIVATGATIDHETIIEDNVLISAGVTIGGYCKIKEGSLVALGAKIISGVEIGKNSLIAAGAVVIESVQDSKKVYGIPAKVKGEE